MTRRGSHGELKLRGEEKHTSTNQTKDLIPTGGISFAWVGRLGSSDFSNKYALSA